MGVFSLQGTLATLRFAHLAVVHINNENTTDAVNLTFVLDYFTKRRRTLRGVRDRKHGKHISRLVALPLFASTAHSHLA